jgi:prepilin-type N-terminal cleavage/methylation domain-containing protein
MKKINLRKGFTLVELIIYMGIFSVLIFIFTDIFVSSIQTKTSGEATAYVNQDANFILRKFEHDLNNANVISQPVPSVSSDSLDFIIYGQPVTYRLNNGILERVNGAEINSLNSFGTTVTGLTFTNLGNMEGKGVIRIDITLESKARVNNRPEVINLQTTVGLR